ncbi:hypothetical protein [Streptomyces sp. URMC 123]|uniref:hypothetical protein n=1 Tax=Streptomyces sp. URMC 123 TaxID=3423403 RepID=UPI003F197F4C
MNALMAASIVLVALIGFFPAITPKLRSVERKVDELDRKLDLICAHLGIDTRHPGLEEVESFLREGKKMSAIKAYRDLTGADLKEAADAIARLTPRA